MNLVFLDIDGVLTDSHSYEIWEPKDEKLGFPPLKKECVEALNQLTEEMRAVIVLTSTWRVVKNAQGWIDLVQFFQEQGIEAPLVSATPRGTNKGAEIEEWFKCCVDPIESFVIIDDDEDVEPFTDKLILTKWDEGLTKELAQEARNVLKRGIDIFCK